MGFKIDFWQCTTYPISPPLHLWLHNNKDLLKRLPLQYLLPTFGKLMRVLWLDYVVSRVRYSSDLGLGAYVRCSITEFLLSLCNGTEVGEQCTCAYITSLYSNIRSINHCPKKVWPIVLKDDLLLSCPPRDHLLTTLTKC